MNTPEGKMSENVLKQAVVYGTILSSSSVEGFGMEKTSQLRRQNIISRLNKFKKILAF